MGVARFIVDSGATLHPADARAKVSAEHELLADAVLRRRAWELAFELGLDTTYPAEYVALAQLQKGTLVSTDAQLLERIRDIVPTATFDVLG